MTQAASAVRWLRASYWVGAVADLGVAVSVLVPERMGATEVTYPMGLAAALAFCWAVLLIWADRRPLERRGVLLPTIFVIAALVAVGYTAVFAGLLPVGRIVPTTLAGGALIALMAFSYRKAGKAETG